MINLKYIPGLEIYGADLIKIIKLQEMRAQSEQKIKSIESQFKTLENELNTAIRSAKPVAIFAVVKKLKEFEKQAVNVSIPDELVARRTSILSNAGSLIASGSESAMDLINTSGSN